MLWLDTVLHTYLPLEMMVSLPAPLGLVPPPATAMAVLFQQREPNQALVSHIAAWEP